MCGNSFIQSLTAKFGRVAITTVAAPFLGIEAAPHLWHATVSGLLVSPVWAKLAFEKALVGLGQLGFQSCVFCFKLRNPLMQSVNIFHEFFPLVNGCSKFSLYQWGFDCQGS